MNDLPDPNPQSETDQAGQEPAGTPELETYTEERIQEFLSEDAMPPALRARAAAQPKRKTHYH